MKVFLLHGTGVHAEGWHTPIVAELKRLWLAYGLSEAVFERKFDLVPVTYDDIFVELVTQWQETASEIAPFADRLGAGQVARLAGWLADADSTQDSIAAHAIDVLLYRGFSLVADAVRDRVLKVITEHLTADSDWAVIAHSLGTAVAHDALDKLWQNSFGQGEPLTGNPVLRQAKAVVMIANLSRLLQSDRDVLTGSWVQPGHLGQPGRMCLRYLNINHRLDPLTRARPFDPTDWPDRASFDAGAYQPIGVRHLHGPNVHDILHYLRNPKAHIPLFRALHYDRAIGRDSELAALTAFGAIQPAPSSYLRTLEAKLEALAPPPSADFESLPDIWDRLQALA